MEIGDPGMRVISRAVEVQRSKRLVRRGKRFAMKKILVMLLLAGCATPLKSNQTALTFISEPPGALIYLGNQAWGIAPLQKIFQSNDGRTQTDAITAVWPSGARITTRFNVQLGRRQTATLSRPIDAPDLHKDLAFAEQLRQGKINRDAANEAALANALRILQPKPTLQTNCIAGPAGTVSCVTN